MNAAKRDRLALRRRLIYAQYVILCREGWPRGTARKMAREKADKLCSEIRSCTTTPESK